MGLFSKSDNDLGTPLDFKFDLLVTVRDRITGFEGVVVCRTQWASNCNTYSVKPAKLNDKGSMIDSEGFDENRLELVPEVAKPMEARRDTGGPCDEPAEPNQL